MKAARKNQNHLWPASIVFFIDVPMLNIGYKVKKDDKDEDKN
jgi:hypothetical protein